MRITMIGHSTVLVEAAGVRILTDPYLGGGGNPAFVRLAPPARAREELSDVQLVLVSHGHFDHLDGRFLRLLAPASMVLAPRLLSPLLKWRTAAQVKGLAPWQTLHYGQVTVTAVPALHWAPAVGYVIQGEGKCLYFAGDTFYRPFMQEIARRWAPQAALLPVTTFRLPMTMSEAGAVRAVQALRPAAVIPIHLGIQPRLPLIRTGQSVAGFTRRLRAAGLETQVVTLLEGDSWSL